MKRLFVTDPALLIAFIRIHKALAAKGSKFKKEGQVTKFIFMYIHMENKRNLQEKDDGYTVRVFAL